MGDLPRVAVKIGSPCTYGWGVLDGIVRYSAAQVQWDLLVEYWGECGGKVSRGQFDGLIARVATRQMESSLLRSGIPVVNISSALRTPRFPTVTCDNALIGRRAAEHLLERGLTHFGYYGPMQVQAYSGERYEAFSQTVGRSGCECRPFEPAKVSGLLACEDHPRQLLQWLRILPRPVGILAYNDHGARMLAKLCRMARIQIPEEVALVGVDNHEAVCRSTIPPLSSVAQSAERIGYEAAKLLDHIMSGGRPPRRPVRIPPTGVVTRLSSDILGFNDPDLRAAVIYIREHASRGIRVKDILAAVPISRRSLERRFRDVLGRSPAAEIRRVQVDMIRTLLSTTRLGMSAIARRTGFSGPDHLCVLFKRKTGQSPREYRRLAVLPHQVLDFEKTP